MWRCLTTLKNYELTLLTLLVFRKVDLKLAAHRLTTALNQEVDLFFIENERSTLIRIELETT